MTRKLFEILADVFSVDVSSITDKTTQNDIENWNSLNTLVLIEELENEYKIKLSIEEVVDLTTISEIKNILQKYGINVN